MKDKRNIGTGAQWAAGLAMSAMLGVMSYQATLTQSQNEEMIEMNKVLREYVESNSKEHTELKLMIEKESGFTSSVYKYEISKNTLAVPILWDAILKNEDDIVVLKRKKE